MGTSLVVVQLTTCKWQVVQTTDEGIISVAGFIHLRHGQYEVLGVGAPPALVAESSLCAALERLAASLVQQWDYV